LPPLADVELLNAGGTEPEHTEVTDGVVAI